MEKPENQDPKVYLAAERTFLAWIRTGLALMGFGFVVARFGLFLYAIQGAQRDSPRQSYTLSTWFGTALVVLGVFVNVSSTWRHIRLVSDLNRGSPALNRPSPLAIAVASVLAIIGTTMAIYLVWVR